MPTPSHITTLDAASGYSGGGTPVVVTGTGFGTSPSVTFGGVYAGHVALSGSQIRCVSPAGSGTVNVTVIDSNGTSNALPFTYSDTYPIFFEDWTSFNSMKWYTTTGGDLGGRGTGSGSNVTVSSNNLHLTASWAGGAGPYYYNTGEVHSQAGFTYGTFEISAKMPPSSSGAGLWPSFWLDSAEASEMDVMEWLSATPTIDYCTYHYHAGSSPTSGPTKVTAAVDLSAAYHVYGFTWTAQSLTWTLDGVPVKTLSAADVAALGSGAFIPTTSKQIILSLYVDDGTHWGTAGAPTTNPGAAYPATYLIDWVRVTAPVTSPPINTFAGTAGDRYRLAATSSSLPTPPGAPTIVKVSPGDTVASVTYSAPSNGGSPITSYTATSNPGGFTASGSVDPLIVTGLTNGTSYTFTVSATNAYGTGPASSPSNAVIPSPNATVPGAPTSASAIAGNATASVSFQTPASNGGATITSYTATATDQTTPGNGGQTASGSVSPITVTGLTNNDSYTFKVTATNAIGTGPASNSTTPVIPLAASVSVPLPGIMLLSQEGQSGALAWTSTYTLGTLIGNYISAPHTNASGVPAIGVTDPAVWTVANNFSGLTVRSMPNYLAQVSGSKWGLDGVTTAPSDDSAASLAAAGWNFISPTLTQSIWTQCVSASVPYLCYAEGATSSNWQSGVNDANYYSRHNSFSYFAASVSGSVTARPNVGEQIAVPNPPAATTAQTANSTTTQNWYKAYLTKKSWTDDYNRLGTPSAPSTGLGASVTTGNLLNDPANISAFVYYATNGINSSHDTSTNSFDAFLSNFIPAVQATDWYVNGGIIIIMWDNWAGTGPTMGTGAGDGNPVGGADQFIIVAKGLHGIKSLNVTDTPGAPYSQQIIGKGTISGQTGGFITTGVSQTGVLQSIQDYYQFNTNPSASVTHTQNYLPEYTSGGSSPNGHAQTSSAHATHPNGSSSNPLPAGYGTILPILKYAAKAVGYTGFG